LHASTRKRKAVLRRKIEEKLSSWKNRQDRKPLVLKGVRQCGKTYSVMKFASENYNNVVYVNYPLPKGYGLVTVQ